MASTALPDPRAETARRVPGRLALRALHWLLTPGFVRQPPAARLRGWARLLEWRQSRNRARTLQRAVWTPVRAWKEAGGEVERFGADVRAAVGLTPAAQRRQLWWLALRHGLGGASYVDYQLYRPERRRRAAAYLQVRETFRVLPWYNRAALAGDPYPVGDKPRFHAWCVRHGLPAVPTLLEFEDGALVTSGLGEAGALPADDLFTKPSDGTGGIGTARWRHAGDGRWTDADGRALAQPELCAELARLSRSLPKIYGKTTQRLLVQPCLRNHRDMRALTSGALATVRILTCRAPGGEPQVVAAVLKMPVGDMTADNFHFGGIIAPVDVGSGRVGPAIERRGQVLAPVERHPDSGAVIAGHLLPWWPEALDAARRGLAAAPARPTLGFDVAIVDDGPVLVEGNTVPNPSLVQQPDGRPLGDTPFPAAVEAHVRRAFGL